MIIEVLGGLVSGSLALISDAGHMLTDFAALIAAYIGMRLAAPRYSSESGARSASQKASIWIALISGLSLILLSAWILWEAYSRIKTPIDVLSLPMLGVAITGLIVNLAVFKILIGANQNSLNMRGAMLHVFGDILGSVAAIAAAIIIMLTGYMMIDPILSALVALLITITAVPLIRDSARALKTA